MTEKRYVKRRKDKYNPYSLYEKGEVRYISFIDGNGRYHEVEVSKELYDLFNEFELIDLSYLNVWDRHIEHSEIWENSLCERAIIEINSVEEIAMENIQKDNLYRAICRLSEIQKRRVILYFFEGLTYAQIAVQEQCSKVAVKYTIDNALRQLKLVV